MDCKRCLLAGVLIVACVGYVHSKSSVTCYSETRTHKTHSDKLQCRTGGKEKEWQVADKEACCSSSSNGYRTATNRNRKLWVNCKSCEGIVQAPQIPESPTPAPDNTPKWGDYECKTVLKRSRQDRACGDGSQCYEHQAFTREAGCDNQGLYPEAGWGEWSEWSACSSTCGKADRLRTRACDSPPPVPIATAAYCATADGGHYEREDCQWIPCPVDCKWTQWSGWGDCSVTCGVGGQTRTRTQKVERDGGRPCTGDDHEQKDCDAGPCPEWMNWSRWRTCSSCVSSCPPNTVTAERRERGCFVLRGHNYEESTFCDERAEESTMEGNKELQTRCSQDGGWSEWSPWNRCRSIKEDGKDKCISERHRRCDNPKARLGGRPCLGSRLDAKECHSC